VNLSESVQRKHPKPKKPDPSTNTNTNDSTTTAKTKKGAEKVVEVIEVIDKNRYVSFASNPILTRLTM
jgi:hypothetical protein